MELLELIFRGMSMIRSRVLALFLILFLSSCKNGLCASVPIDLLQGWSDFEVASHVVRWNSQYATINYDYKTVWPYMKIPSTNDTLAVGWKRSSGTTIDPNGDNFIFKLLPNGINGTNCQYFAIKGFTGYAWLSLVTTVPASTRTGIVLHKGDTITFKIDSISMSDFNSNTTCYLKITTSSGEVLLPLEFSQTAKSVQISTTAAESESKIVAEVLLVANLTSESEEPQVYVDGAHIYITRSGQSTYDTREVPTTKNRTIKTASMFWFPDKINEYATASNFDYVMFSDDSISEYITRLKSINPSIKTYLYRNSLISQNGDDPQNYIYSNSPIIYSDASSNHPEWFYNNGISTNTYLCLPDYSYLYYSKRALSSYQTAWISGALDRAQGCNFDGIFIDDIGAVSRAPVGSDLPITKPQIGPWELQSFLHTVIPSIRSANLGTINNTCKLCPTNGEGQIYCNPFWKPDKTYSTSMGYTENSPEDIPDAMFNEWAFFSPYTLDKKQNRYDSSYWLQCLQDMDTIKSWNTATGTNALPSSLKKMIFMNVRGCDNTNDPAYGIDGWLNFGLCSYLLGQNDWTVFCCGLVSDDATKNYYADMDYSITKKLGIPDGDETTIDGDTYFRSRNYKSSASDELGGLVIVNANTDASRSYTTTFDSLINGSFVSKGTTITLPPHTGRILIKATSVVSDAPDVSVDVVVPSTAVKPGQTVSITVKYTNNGTADAKNLQVQAVVPTQMKYVTGSAEASGGTYNKTTNTISWTISTLASGQSGTRTFKATVN